MSEQKSVEKFVMLCNAHHLEVPEVRDVMGRPQRWVLTADLTCMSKYQLREWQRSMFLSITCFWSIYSLKKSLIPEISPGGPQRGGTGRDERKNTSWKLILHVWAKISWKICDALRCPSFGGPWGQGRDGTSPKMSPNSWFDMYE